MMKKDMKCKKFIFLLQQMCNPAKTGAETSLKSLDLDAQQEPNQVTQ